MVRFAINPKVDLTVRWARMSKGVLHDQSDHFVGELSDEHEHLEEVVVSIQSL